MRAVGAENFTTSAPIPNKQGAVYYSSTATMLQRGQLWPLNITLFELYPIYTGDNPTWATGTVPLDLGSGSAVEDLLVLESTIEIFDVVSGYSSPTTYTYSSDPYATALNSKVSAPQTLNYTISAGIPLPRFTLLVTRNSPEGAAQVSLKAFIPILGTVPAEVPNFYPVTTDPTLIFMVLRDPPGGASHVTIAAGTSFSTTISIQGMKAFEQDIHFDLEANFAMAEDGLLITAPLGFGVAKSAGEITLNIGGKGSLVAPDITVRRTIETQYSYAFQFSYDFSTSDDPFIAGHPSDVIIGGGIDVIVSQALEGNSTHWKPLDELSF